MDNSFYVSFQVFCYQEFCLSPLARGDAQLSTMQPKLTLNLGIGGFMTRLGRKKHWSYGSFFDLISVHELLRTAQGFSFAALTCL